MVNCVFDAMTEALRQGEGVEIRGFGSLKARAHKSYQGRNPRTGEKIKVAKRRFPAFKAGRTLKAAVKK